MSGQIKITKWPVLVSSMTTFGTLTRDKDLWQKKFYYLVLPLPLTKAPLYLRVLEFLHSKPIAAISRAGRRMPKQTGLESGQNFIGITLMENPYFQQLALSKGWPVGHSFN